MEKQVFVQSEARQKIEEDLNERVKVHQANIKRLAVAQRSAHTLALSVLNCPLVMFAQGDSWFDYPLTGNGFPFVDTDVIAQLRRMGDVPPIILNQATHGDAATDEMSLTKQQRMITQLSEPANWLNGKPDAILISAGGNDIAGEQFC